MAKAREVGRFVWYDLVTTDVDAAKAFYCEVLGWGTAPFEVPGSEPYTMWMAGEAPIGGVVPIGPDMQGVPPNWLGYVRVADVDRSVAEAERLGGVVHKPPTDYPEVGRLAVLSDPQGAALALYRPSEDRPVPPFDPSPLHFSWHELGTTDWRAAMDFYERMFGWTLISENDMGALGVYAVFGEDGVPYGGVFDKPPAMPVSAWCYYVRVPSVREAVQRTEQNGGKVLVAPMEVPGGDWIAQCLDPQGAMFALHQRGS